MVLRDKIDREGEGGREGERGGGDSKLKKGSEVG